MKNERQFVNNSIPGKSLCSPDMIFKSTWPVLVLWICLQINLCLDSRQRQQDQDKIVLNIFEFCQSSNTGKNMYLPLESTCIRKQCFMKLWNNFFLQSHFSGDMLWIDIHYLKSDWRHVMFGPGQRCHGKITTNKNIIIILEMSLLLKESLWYEKCLGGIYKQVTQQGPWWGEFI